jgi:hypothetical protein
LCFALHEECAPAVMETYFFYALSSPIPTPEALLKLTIAASPARCEDILLPNPPAHSGIFARESMPEFVRP